MTTSGTRGEGTAVLEPLSPPADDTDTAYYAPREGDLLMLALLFAVVLGTGGYTWHQLGATNTVGRAIFFGLLIFCVLWAALVYTFKLSFGVVVGPHGIGLNRGPWRTELSWSETARLVERTETHDARRYRWVVAMAYDTRRLQVREDMVGDYERFRHDVYLRFRNWQDHGGTWGTAASGPFKTSDQIRPQITWRLIGMALLLIPGAYFWVLLPDTGLLGPALIACGVLCAVLALGTWLKRQTYMVDNHQVSSKRPLRPATVLRWSKVTKVERVRHPFGWLVRIGIFFGNAVLELLARGDSRVRSFPWSPRVPEYLVLRGAGHHVRFRLHRLARPDELLAWVEYYERIGRHLTQPSAEADAAAFSPLVLGRPEQSMPAPPAGGGAWNDTWVEEESAPADPWAETHTLENSIRQDGATTQPARHASAPGHDPQPDGALWPSSEQGTPGAGRSRSARDTARINEFQPPAGYTPISRPIYETERHHVTSAPGSEPEDDDDAWLRETQAHFRLSRPGTAHDLSARENPAPTGTPPNTATPRPRTPMSPYHRSQPDGYPGTQPGPQPRDPDATVTRPGRPHIPSRPIQPGQPGQPGQPPRQGVPPQPMRPPDPAQMPPRPPQPTPPPYAAQQPGTQPGTPFGSLPGTQPPGDEHGDGFDQPTMDFQQAPPPQLPRFGPDKRER